MAHYVFVASAGAYKANKIEPALFEGDARKESAGHVAVEKYLEEQVLHAVPSLNISMSFTGQSCASGMFFRHRYHTNS